MPSFLQNRFVKFALIGLGALIALFVFLFVVFTGLNIVGSTTGLNEMSAPMPMSADYGGTAANRSYDAVEEIAYAPSYMPATSPDGYTAGLESYETTSYHVSGKTKQFDELCQTVANLKSDPTIHFKSINTSTNYCQANFYVEDEQVGSVVSALSGYKGIELTRDTSSVTRHKQRLQSRTTILQQQLARVEETLLSAEAQLDRLNSRFHTTDEVVDLSSEVTKSLRFIDEMTNKKINLISQLDNVYQQSADLEARMNVTEFSVSVSRSNPIYPNKYENKWEQAWEDLRDTVNEALIGITAFFGIFLLWVLRVSVYLLVVIIILRLFWKFVKLVWGKL